MLLLPLCIDGANVRIMQDLQENAVFSVSAWTSGRLRREKDVEFRDSCLLMAVASFTNDRKKAGLFYEGDRRKERDS